jgi:hypothetical protein
MQPSWAVARSYGCRLFVILTVLLAGCNLAKVEESAAADSARTQSAISTVESGPVKLTASLRPAKVRLSDESVLTLTIETIASVEIDKPDFGEELASFKIIETQDPLPKTREGREIYQKILTLEPTETGKQTIYPLAISFRDKRPGADDRPQSIATKPLVVEVVSKYAKETPSLGDLHGSADPLALPWRIPLWGWAILAGLLIAAILGVLYRYRKKKEQAALAVVLSPEELARLELQKLADSGWMETDVKQYFVELTAIVRRYIERTTGIRAPEQTTEEFLREISRKKSLFDGSLQILSAGAEENSAKPRPAVLQGPSAIEHLKTFLESADLVKFAAFHPRREDIRESFQRAEIFIGLKSPQTAVESKETFA